MLAGPLMECKSGLSDRSLLSAFLLDLVSLKVLFVEVVSQISKYSLLSFEIIHCNFGQYF